MSIISFEFLLLYLPLSVILFWSLHYLAGYTSAKIFLVGASLTLIASIDSRSVVTLCGFLLVNYFLYFLSKKWLKSKTLLCHTAVVLNLLFLAIFKYFLFFQADIGAKYREFLYVSDYLIPLGISFYTFQLISFWLDHKKGKSKDITFLNFLLYVSFFPQLISGPIVRINRFYSQLQKSRLSHRFIYAGCVLIVLGIAKKCIIGDSLMEIYQDKVGPFHDDILLPWDKSVAMWFGMSAQLYFDFSAYSDIAVGLGYLFGFSLPVNFRSPYRQPSVVMCWRNWNITVMKFIRDYVYYQTASLPKWLRIYLVMLLFALWHGPFFVIFLFAALNASLILLNMYLYRNYFPKMPNWMQVLINRGLLISGILITVPFFRSMDVLFTLHMFKSALTPRDFQLTHLDGWQLLFPIFAFLLTLMTPNSFEWLHGRYLKMPPVVGAVLLGGLAFCTLFFVERSQNFIYFFF